MATTQPPRDPEADGAVPDASAGAGIPSKPRARSPRTSRTPGASPAGGTASTDQPTVVPTEQLPLPTAPLQTPAPQAPPLSASAAASQGATGLDETWPSTGDRTTAGARTTTGTGTGRQPSVFRSHPIASGVTAGLVAVILASGLTAWGVSSAVTASLTSSNSAPIAAPTATATPSPSKPAGGKRLAFRATIQSIDGNTWTILTRKGKTVTVDITSTTLFGTKKSVETPASFAVGDSVVIVAARGADGTPTAARVVSAADLGAGAAGGAGGSTTAPGTTTTPNT